MRDGVVFRPRRRIAIWALNQAQSLFEWREPKRGQKAGFGKWKNPKSPYDLFMEAQGIPIHRDIGVHKVQDLPLQPWKRLGGRGTAIQLLGTEHLWGMYVVEVPGAGALNAERHLYEEIYYVVDGRGTTEVWQEGQQKKTHIRMEPRLVVRDSAQCLAPSGQRHFVPGVIAGRHDGAEHHQSHSRCRVCHELQL